MGEAVTLLALAHIFIRSVDYGVIVVVEVRKAIGRSLEVGLLGLNSTLGMDRATGANTLGLARSGGVLAAALGGRLKTTAGG